MFGRGIEIKTPDQLKAMRRAGLVVARTLVALGEHVAPGVTTRELDLLARDMLATAGAESSFLGYGASWGPPFTGVTCISVNDEIVHGIPGDRVLAEGDLVSVDFGAILDGWHGDAARTFGVGAISAENAELSRVTEESMWAGIGAAQLGARIGDIGAAVQSSISSAGNYGIIREYTGHGIGTEMHMSPDVPNWGRKGRGARIVEGMALAIEPMATLGTEETVELDDEWTVVTADGSWASHWENTVTATKHGMWVLTMEDGGEQALTSRGLPFGPLAD
ncbi:type I methionyl aminopeptidase [Propionibacteriaceae bacterium G1746]